MRITNMMTSQKMYNDITKNRVRVDKYYTQMSTGKSIMYPSDDPIRASRALKFRTNVSQAEQYQRNVTQGYSWMEISELAIANVEEITERIRTLASQGASDSYDADDRSAIATEISSLIEELGIQMNQTYGGRNVFTGYKTDVPAVFTSSSSKVYDINQSFSYLDIEGFRAYSKTALNDVANIVDGYRLLLPYKHVEASSIDFKQTVNFGAVNNAATTISSVTDIALDSYEIEFNDRVPADMFATTGKIIIDGSEYTVDKSSIVPDADGNINKLTIIAATTKPNAGVVATNTASATGGTIVYDALSKGFKISSDYTFIEDVTINGKNTFTGTITIGGKQYAIDEYLPNNTPYDQTKVYYDKNSDTYYFPDALTEEYKDATKVPISVSVNDYFTATQQGKSITVNELKSSSVDAYKPGAWEVNYIEDTGELVLSKEVKEYLTNLEREGFTIDYTKSDFIKGEINPLVYFDCVDKTLPTSSSGYGKTYDMKNQSLEYEFSTNIRIGVNNLAKDILTPAMYSELNEFCTFLDNARVSHKIDLELYYSSAPYNLQNEELAKKVDEHISVETQKSREALQKRFEVLLGNLDGFASTISKQRADLGTRMSRLELLGNRLNDDKMSYTKLLSENEDADLMEAVMNRKTCDAMYQASLSVSAKLLQTSLVDFLR